MNAGPRRGAGESGVGGEDEPQDEDTPAEGQGPWPVTGHPTPRAGGLPSKSNPDAGGASVFSVNGAEGPYQRGVKDPHHGRAQGETHTGVRP